MIGAQPICMECGRFHRDRKEMGLTCDAFPDGIPDEIIMGDSDHKEPVEGDHGLQFEPMEREET